MLKKNYKYLLTFICLYSCKDAPSTVRNEFLKQREKSYLAAKKHFLDLFSRRELLTVDVQGYYNFLLEFSQKCNDPDFRGLLVDLDICEAILDGFTCLYQFHKNVGADLGMLDEEQRNFTWEKIRSCGTILEQRIRSLNFCIDIETIDGAIDKKRQELREQENFLKTSTNERENERIRAIIEGLGNDIDDLEKRRSELQDQNDDQYSQDIQKLFNERDRLCSLLSHVNYILGNKFHSFIPSEENSLSGLYTYIKDLFVKKNEIDERRTLTDSGEVAAKKVISLIEIFQDRRKIQKDLNITEPEFEDTLSSILLHIASEVLIIRGYVLKENDFAQSSFRRPNFLMELLLNLLPYNSITNSDRYKNFDCKGNQEEKNFILNIIFTALVATSDVQCGHFNPNVFLYLRFDTVDIDRAFEIKAMLDYFCRTITKDILKTDHLSLLFQDPTFYTNSKETLEQAAQDRREEFLKKIITNEKFNAGSLKDSFRRQVYRNLAKKNIVAFGDNGNDPLEFYVDEVNWERQISGNFLQKVVPPSLFYSIPASVVKNSVSVRYNESLLEKYFSSLTLGEDTFFKRMVFFVDETLRCGISVEGCQQFKAFSKQIFNKCLEVNTMSKVFDVFNFRYEQYGILEPIFTYSGISVDKDNVEQIIQLIHKNRSDNMLYEDVLMERILNIFLLKALTDLVK